MIGSARAPAGERGLDLPPEGVGVVAVLVHGGPDEGVELGCAVRQVRPAAAEARLVLADEEAEVRTVGDHRSLEDRKVVGGGVLGVLGEQHGQELRGEQRIGEEALGNEMRVQQPVQRLLGRKAEEEPQLGAEQGGAVTAEIFRLGERLVEALQVAREGVEARLLDRGVPRVPDLALRFAHLVELGVEVLHQRVEGREPLRRFGPPGEHAVGGPFTVVADVARVEEKDPDAGSRAGLVPDLEEAPGRLRVEAQAVVAVARRERRQRQPPSGELVQDDMAGVERAAQLGDPGVGPVGPQARRRDRDGQGQLAVVDGRPEQRRTRDGVDEAGGLGVRGDGEDIAHRAALVEQRELPGPDPQGEVEVLDGRGDGVPRTLVVPARRPQSKEGGQWVDGHEAVRDRDRLEPMVLDLQSRALFSRNGRAVHCLSGEFGPVVLFP
ncbi:hypothetical protein [Actinomadura parmotrematis]|uniref:Uncharacterized protein n=1 Tax=Actinomadura parmotrematis TaxID=2864039 RepID=A0ABS7G0U1_9ACTN|nr:hypothetical protein [Actinomadura parmotrematis]MBW8486329.1 hypothetical protein [Actinomadura parmotrematis]